MPTTEYETIEYRKEGKIAIFSLNRPDVLNAQNTQLHHELNVALLDFRDDSDLWVGIINGYGRAFSAGADIKDFTTATIGGNIGFRRIRAEQIWKPFIAAIHGYCLGGGLQLAMECDLRIATDDARFGYPEVLISYFPGSECTLRLPRYINRTHVMELMLTGKQINAEEAYRIGLINLIVPRDELMQTVMDWAASICEAGPLGVQAAKEMIIRGYDMSWDDGIKLEAELATRIRNSNDFKEGTSAFIEKRKPQFKAQ